MAKRNFSTANLKKGDPVRFGDSDAEWRIVSVTPRTVTLDGPFPAKGGSSE